MNPKRNIDHQVATAFFQLLDGISVNVYRTDAPSDETGNYVLIRVESSTDGTNNARHVSNVVVITEVVTLHRIRIDDSIAPGIDDEIAQRLFSRTGVSNLSAQAGIQITDVRRSNATYIQEDDGVTRYHRLITRNNCRVAQLETVNG